jgi:hypothetical protein
VSSHLQLDPFRGQIVLIGRYDKRMRRIVHRPQVTVDGRRAIASRHGLVGIEGPQWCAARKHEDDALDWLDVWDRDGYPYAARVFAYRAGWDKPTNGTVRWAEFAQRDGNGELIPQWRAMPAHMLGKVAESLALRRAFPEAIGQALIAVEFDTDDNGSEQPEVIAPPAIRPQVDDARADAEADATDAEGPKRSPRPSSAMEFIVPSREQEKEIRELWKALGLAGNDYRRARLSLIEDAIGRAVERTTEMDANDCAALIIYLRKVLADEQAREADAQSPQEPMSPEP